MTPSRRPWCCRSAVWRPQIGRLEDAPAEIAALLANLADLGLTHTRRSEEQVALDQFSTPPQLGALAVLAAQVRAGRPGAGAFGRHRPPGDPRRGLRREPDPQRDRRRPRGPARRACSRPPRAPPTTRCTCATSLPGSGGFHAVIANPPVPAPGGAPARRPRLPGRRRPAVGHRPGAAVRGRAGPCVALAERGRVVLRLAFPARAYAKHGTSVETGLLVIDRGAGDAAMPRPVIAAETLADAARAAAAVEARPTAQPRQFRVRVRSRPPGPAGPGAGHALQPPGLPEHHGAGRL